MKDDGRAAICDFGQARLIEARSGMTTELRCAPKYSAPELIAPHDDDEGPEGEINNDGDSDDVPTTGRMTSTEADVWSFAMSALEGCMTMTGLHICSDMGGRYLQEKSRFMAFALIS